MEWNVPFEGETQVVEISVTVHNSPVQDYTLTRTIIFHLHVLIHVHVFSRQILKHFSFLLFILVL